MSELKPIFNALLRSKAGALMLLFQIAITTAIVSNAAFIIYDRMTYLNQDTGYPEDEVFYFRVTSFAENADYNQQIELDETLLRNIPGVINAAHFTAVPLSGSGSSSGFSIVPAPEDGRSANAAYTMADHNAIDTLGVKLIAGRNFTEEDVVHTQNYDKLPTVAIVTKAWADELFPDEDPLGKTFYVGADPAKIIGIVEHMMSPWPNSSVAEKVVIFPMVNGTARQKFIVRAHASERAAIMRQVEDLLLQENNQRVITSLQGLDEAKAEYNASDTLMLRMLLVLIVVLVSVTALGIFGLTLFNISKRTKQIGTRRAIGARKSDIIRYFLLENTMVCVGGLVVGCIGAILVAQQLMQLYSLPALDYAYVAGTAVFVLLISLLAVIVPAKRAANISPSIATRSI
ncbi:ABC transporter permease [Planctobacterium marinum]|uniref:ABC transporter permease n=1 Tax=Planctobacterium marinum TaxID=1631968 RepID=A0AA48HWJ3_9ALTE|nr:ABC transporter permease [Planctobacterium marinum]